MGGCVGGRTTRPKEPYPGDSNGCREKKVQIRVLKPMSRPTGPAMKDKSKTAGPASATVNSVRRFAAQTEAAIADLEERVPAGMGFLERALAERLRAALARLLECIEQLEVDGLVVEGSTVQQRPNQLLKVEQELRREISDGLEKLVFRAENNASFIQAQALTRKRGGARS
jgi:hypothetical protein